MTADWAIALATAALVFATLCLAVAAYAQLRAERIRRMETGTLDVCTRFDIDPIIYQANRRIWDASQEGTTYFDADKHSVITVANYLDGIAIGVLQGLYSSDIVRDHLGPVIGKYINVIVPSVFGSKKDYEALDEVCSAWAVGTTPVTYKRPGQGSR